MIHCQRLRNLRDGVARDVVAAPDRERQPVPAGNSTASTMMAGVWMGDLDLAGAIRSRMIILEGLSHLTCAFPGWLGLNPLAGVIRPSLRE